MSKLSPEKEARLHLQKGKHWYKCLETQEDGLFFEQPPGWVPGRFSRGNMGINLGQLKFNITKKKSEWNKIQETADAKQCWICGHVFSETDDYKYRKEWHHLDLHRWEETYTSFADLYKEGCLIPLCHKCHRLEHKKTGRTYNTPDGKKKGLRGAANGMFGKEPPNKKIKLQNITPV